MVEHDSIGLLLGRFGLSSLHGQLEEVEAAAGNGSWTYRQFLRELLEREEALRSGRRLKRLLKESQLPEAKTAANLELKGFSQATRQAFTQLCEGGFCEAAQNVLAFGLPGRGKTHFLAAVGHELILRHQKRILFVPTFKLVQRLLEAKKRFELETLLKKLDGFDSSSTVRKIRSLALNDLRKSKRALALHFRAARYHWSSRKVGGMATPVARTA